MHVVQQLDVRPELVTDPGETSGTWRKYLAVLQVVSLGIAESAGS